MTEALSPCGSIDRIQVRISIQPRIANPIHRRRARRGREPWFASLIGSEKERVPKQWSDNPFSLEITTKCRPGAGLEFAVGGALSWFA